MSDDAERDERVQRFNWLCERAAKVLGLPMDHQRVVVQAGLDFAYERFLNGMIDTGRPTELAAFVRLSELEIQTAPPPPIGTIRVKFVEGKARPPDEPPPTPTPPATNVVPADAKAVAGPSNVTPLPQRPPPQNAPMSEVGQKRT